MRPWTRKNPWPGQLGIGGKRYMLRATEDGEMVGRKATRLDAVTPITYDISNLKPYVERPYALGPLVGGMGEVRQADGPPTRYRHAIDADLSIGGVRRNGPILTQATLPATSIGEVRGFVAGQHAGLLEVFAYGYGGVLKRTTGTETWTLSDNRTGGIAPTAQQAVRFRPQDASAPDSVIVAWSDNLLRYYDGAVWATATISFSIGGNFVERNNEELWIWGLAGNPGLSKCTSDFRVDGNWASPFWVGDRAYDVTYLRSIADQLFIFKQDGVYSVLVQALGIRTPELFPELRGLAGTQHFNTPALRNNGRNAHPWNGYLWFPFLGQSYRMSPGEEAELEPTGLARLIENDSEVRGEQTAFADDGHFGWYAYYNAALNASYLCKHGTWLNPDTDNTAEYAFADVVNGAVRKLPGKKITALEHIPDETGQPRLWVGCSDGSIYHAVLPKNGPDPAQDPLCRFVTMGKVYWPDHDARDPANLKHWRGFSVAGPRLDASNYVQIGFRATDQVDFNAVGVNFTVTGQRAVTPGSQVYGMIQVEETLVGTSTTTPEVSEVVIHEQTRPALQLEYDVVVIAADNVALLNGAFDRRTGEQIRAALKLTAGPGPTEVYLPDGTRMEVDFVDYSEALAPIGRRNGLAWDVGLKLVEFRTL